MPGAGECAGKWIGRWNLGWAGSKGSLRWTQHFSDTQHFVQLRIRGKQVSVWVAAVGIKRKNLPVTLSSGAFVLWSKDKPRSHIRHINKFIKVSEPFSSSAVTMSPSLIPKKVLSLTDNSHENLLGQKEFLFIIFFIIVINNIYITFIIRTNNS